MEKGVKNRVHDLLRNAIPKAMSYEDYRKLVDQLAADGDTTGDTKSASLIGYTQLNSRRMKRWDKTLKFSQEQIERIQAFDGQVLWLVLTESWCGDAAPSMPVMHKMASLNPGITYRVLLRDEHPELMDHFLTDGARAIPKLIMLDQATLEVLGEWGSRPGVAAEKVRAFKAENGQLSPEFKEDLQLWYNKDKGYHTVEDLIGLLALKEVGDGPDL